MSISAANGIENCNMFPLIQKKRVLSTVSPYYRRLCMASSLMLSKIANEPSLCFKTVYLLTILSNNSDMTGFV